MLSRARATLLLSHMLMIASITYFPFLFPKSSVKAGLIFNKWAWVAFVVKLFISTLAPKVTAFIFICLQFVEYDDDLWSDSGSFAWTLNEPNCLNDLGEQIT